MERRLLIIDDSLEFLKSLTNLLELYHYKVKTTTCGQEGIKLLSSHNFDLVLCDFHAPNVGGIELLERVKLTLNSDIPIILMARHISVDRTLNSIRLGAADLIRKPIDDFQIIKAISRQLDKKKVNPYQLQISSFLVGTHYSFEFTAHDFVSTNIVDFLTNHLSNIKNITPAIVNELSLCVEELISNAFIHGTFGLGSAYKELSNDQYNRFITQLLGRPSISEKKVFINITYRKSTSILTISVTDQGSGFNYKNIKIDETNLFRGIGLISVLCDKVAYSNGGRTVRIEKILERKPKPASVSSQG